MAKAKSKMQSLLDAVKPNDIPQEDWTMENLTDPMWRICNLYQIKDTKGIIQKFSPRPFQLKLARRILVDGHKRFLIPKSRRQGASTVIGVIMADTATFNPNVDCALVDKTQTDAADKIDTIMTQALLSVAKLLPRDIELAEPNKGKLGVRLKGNPHFSTLQGGKFYRGSGLAFLHVSELGTIAASEPKRAKEIVAGSIPAASEGVVVIETTVKGGRVGAFWGMVDEALKIPDEHRGVMDWEVLFLPWWQDPNCVDHNTAMPIRPGTQRYFARLEVLTGQKFPDERMRFWQRQYATYGNNVFEEYPSTIEEAFDVPLSGSILGGKLGEALTEGRVGDFENDTGQPCYATWDLGAALNTIATIFQIRDGDKYILGAECGDPEMSVGQRVGDMLRRYPNLSANFFPHDAANVYHSGTKCQLEVWADAGLPNIQVLPRTSDVWVGINKLIGTFDTYRFDQTGCSVGLQHWQAYRLAPQVGSDTSSKNTPVHDYASHWADSLRMIAEAESANMFEQTTVTGVERPMRVTMGKYGNKTHSKEQMEPGVPAGVRSYLRPGSRGYFGQGRPGYGKLRR